MKKKPVMKDNVAQSEWESLLLQLFFCFCVCVLFPTRIFHEKLSNKFGRFHNIYGQNL